MKPESLIALVVGLSLNALANILLKVSALRLEAKAKELGQAVGALGQYLEPVFIAGALSFVLALVAYRRALQSVPLSIAYPIMTSCGYIIVLGASFFLLRESLSVKQMAGIGLLIAGVWLTSSR
jgi:multidrug transporter EmrE-like cation transporter